MIPGMNLTIDGETVIVPPLTLGQLRSGMLAKLKEHDELVAKGEFFEALTLRGEIILAALRRNYPDFAEAKLFDFLDVNNTVNVWLYILGASGFKPGEAEAAKPATDGTSAPSIAA